VRLLETIKRCGGGEPRPLEQRTWRRLVLLLVVLALLRGFVYGMLIPPWQSPDEHGHFEYAWLVSRYGPLVGPEAISAAFQGEVLASMARYGFWRFIGQPTPDPLPRSFTEPTTLILAQSRPQVGDERPLYYLLVGLLLRLAGDADVATGMYIGRAVSVLLSAAAVGVTALATRRLFPGSLFMQLIPPFFVLSLPMLGQMGAAVSSDALGVLSGALFFASLVPVFLDGLTWRRGLAVLGALVLALLSKKTALFLLPTALLALPVYGWVRGVRLSRRLKWALAGGAVLLVGVGAALALMPAGDATGWLARGQGCGPTRLAEGAWEGEAVLRVGPCADGWVAQNLSPEATLEVAGRTLTLSGRVRGVGGPLTATVAVVDSAGTTQIQVDAADMWQPFTVTHTVSADPGWVAVRLLPPAGADSVLLFDGLALSDEEGRLFLVNGSAEGSKRMLLWLWDRVAGRLGTPRRMIDLLLLPQSWGRAAWREYVRAAAFCFRSFWGNFGWLKLPLAERWYRWIEAFCLVALVGVVWFLLRRPGRSGRVGYLLVLLGALLLLALQTLLPMVSARGTYWLPQGRYLFPGLFAIALVLAWGIDSLLPAWADRWGTLIGLLALAVFDGLCLVGRMVPYFYL